jgi:hypothetical protein
MQLCGRVILYTSIKNMMLYYSNCEWHTNFKCFNCFIEANKRISDNFKLINLTQDNVKPFVIPRFTVQSYLTRDLKKERIRERAQQSNKENKNKNIFFFSRDPIDEPPFASPTTASNRSVDSVKTKSDFFLLRRFSIIFLRFFDARKMKKRSFISKPRR